MYPYCASSTTSQHTVISVPTHADVEDQASSAGDASNQYKLFFKKPMLFTGVASLEAR